MARASSGIATRFPTTAAGVTRPKWTAVIGAVSNTAAVLVTRLTTMAFMKADRPRSNDRLPASR